MMIAFDESLTKIHRNFVNDTSTNMSFDDLLTKSYEFIFEVVRLSTNTLTLTKCLMKYFFPGIL